MNIEPERKAAIEEAIASEQNRRSLDEIYAIGLAHLIRGNGPLLKDVYGEEVRAVLREHGQKTTYYTLDQGLKQPWEDTK